MNAKFLKPLTITLSLFVFLGVLFAAPNVLAQNLPGQARLKITSVGEGMFLNSNVYVKGMSAPNATILLSIKNQNDTFSYSVKTNSDGQGKWFVNFDQLLKRGTYYIEATQEDRNGVEISSFVYGPVKIRGSFALIVGIFSFLVIVLLAGFVGGWYLNKFLEAKRYRRILISQRDIISSYNMLKGDVDAALKNLGAQNLGEGKISETKYLLKRTAENLEKMHKYIIKGVNIIGKYDIMSKIDNKLKFKKK